MGAGGVVEHPLPMAGAQPRAVWNSPCARFNAANTANPPATYPTKRSRVASSGSVTSTGQYECTATHAATARAANSTARARSAAAARPSTRGTRRNAGQSRPSLAIRQ